MLIGVPKETLPGELRAPLVPVTVKKLVGLGFEVTVEPGVGEHAGFPDAQYTDAGAKLEADRDTLLGSCGSASRRRRSSAS